jgi:hypothetical protein
VVGRTRSSISELIDSTACAADGAERRALAHAALAADHASDALELARHAHVLVDQVVEGAVQLAHHAAAAGGETGAEVAVARRDERFEERLEQARVDLPVRVAVLRGSGGRRRRARGRAACGRTLRLHRLAT